MPDLTSAALAKQIAEALGEANIRLLRRVVNVLGIEAVQAYLAETQRIEADGGALIVSGKRRRTPGGVFFRLVREACTPEQYKAIGWRNRATAAQSSNPRPPRRRTEVQPLPWDTCLAHIQDLLVQRGIAAMSKITLTGRPGRIIEAQGAILTVMTTDPAKSPTLPKGLPTPPAQPTRYIVYIATKQWAKVAEAINDPGDALIIEGYPVYDERLPGIAVLTQNVTTRNQQRAKRESGG